MHQNISIKSLKGWFYSAKSTGKHVRTESANKSVSVKNPLKRKFVNYCDWRNLTMNKAPVAERWLIVRYVQSVTLGDSPLVFDRSIAGHDPLTLIVPRPNARHDARGPCRTCIGFSVVVVVVVVCHGDSRCSHVWTARTLVASKSMKTRVSRGAISLK